MELSRTYSGLDTLFGKLAALDVPSVRIHRIRLECKAAAFLQTRPQLFLDEVKTLA